MNFDTFGESLTATMLALYNEEWHLAMYQHYLGVGYSSFVFYIPLIVIGQMTFVTLFSALFLNSFIKNIKKHIIEKENQFKPTISVLFKQFKSLWSQMTSNFLKKSDKIKNDKFPRNSKSKILLDQKSILKRSPTMKERSIKKLASLKNQFKSFSNLRKKRDILFGQTSKNLLAMKKNFSRNETLVTNQQSSFKKIKLLPTTEPEKELIIRGYFQGFSIFVIEHPYFKNFMIIITIASLILLMINTPVSDPNSTDIIVCDIIEKIFIAFYIIEFVLTIKGVGFYKYWFDYMKKNYFVLFNTFNVIISICSLVENKYESRVCETLKIIRVFRLVSTGTKTFHHMHLISSSLIKSLPNIGKLLVFFTIFLYVFSLFAMKYLKGQLYVCDLLFESGESEMFEINNKNDCFDYGGNWINKDYNYDNILRSFFTLFVISSSEGWSNLM